MVKKRKNKTEEHIEQCKVVEWFDMQIVTGIFPGHWEHLLWAIPNGGKRDIHTANSIQNEGGRSGIPDLMLSIPSAKFPGLFIEMKKKKGGRVSDSQKKMIPKLRKVGYMVEVCEGAAEAISVLKNYLEDVGF